jgi:hypothetical protein
MHTYKCMCKRVCLCTCGWKGVCMEVFGYLCVFYTCVWRHLCVCINVSGQICVFMYTYFVISACFSEYTCMETCVFLCTCLCPHMGFVCTRVIWVQLPHTISCFLCTRLFANVGVFICLHLFWHTWVCLFYECKRVFSHVFVVFCVHVLLHTWLLLVCTRVCTGLCFFTRFCTH